MDVIAIVEVSEAGKLRPADGHTVMIIVSVA